MGEISILQSEYITLNIGGTWSLSYSLCSTHFFGADTLFLCYVNVRLDG